MELMDLPDDALVSVLQSVTAEDLFTCRLVCKRLGGLALHWDAWRRRDVELRYLDAPLARALLHLVPCLQGATVDERDILELSKSKCAVADLTLRWLGRYSDVELYYARAVRNQEALGRLRRLYLIFGNLYDEDASKELAKTVMECSALVELEIAGHSLTMARPVPQEPARPTLKIFRCASLDVDLPFINTLLTVHGATLEEVMVVLKPNNLGRYSFSETMPHILGALPRLRSLNCYAIPGLQAVAACTTLEELHLIVRTWEPTFVQGARELLLQSRTLREVHILIELPGIAEGLMKALGSSNSRLIVEQLELKVDRYDEIVWWLPFTLPSLPALRSLQLTDFETAPDDDYQTPPGALDRLLLAITPETAPALRTLELKPCNFKCMHAWIHSAVVKKALAMNPSLHILLRGFQDFDCRYCKVCRSTYCHEEVRNETVWKICLFSHDLRTCTSPYHSFEAGELRQWKQINLYK